PRPHLHLPPHDLRHLQQRGGGHRPGAAHGHPRGRPPLRHRRSPLARVGLVTAVALMVVTRELRLRLVLGLNLALAAALVVAGFVADSLGLFAAAGDTVTDVGAVLLSLLAVLLDTVGDAAANTGVAAAGAVILLSGRFEWLDAAVSIAIAVVIAARAVRLLMQAADVLLESTPPGLDLDELASAMKAVEGVDAVHDLHVWSLSSEVRALSAHLVLSGHPTLEEAQVVGDRLRATIGPRFAIAHATLELECESCVQEDGEPCAE